MSDTAKKTFGKYEAISHLGSGAMGVVWRAQDPILGRTVAIKTISAALGSDNENKERFLREARAAAQLNHPNIITVFDFGQADDELYMAMELLEGKDLKELITEGQLTFEQKLDIMEQVADGLAYAHGRDVVHRDLKPGNIHVQPNGQVKILDFGLARLGSSDLTKTGVVMGTPNYMSPEQVMGERADARSDVFSTGALFYELLTNRKPFDAESIHATLYQVVHRDPPPPRQWDATLPDPIVTIIETSMAKQRDSRYKNAGALRDAIRAFRYGDDAEVVEYEEGAAEAAPEVSSSDATSISQPSGPSGSGPQKPGSFRAYGKTGPASVAPSTGVAAANFTTSRITRPGSKPPGPGQPSDTPTVQPHLQSNLKLMVGGGIGLFLIVVMLGYWIVSRRSKPEGPTEAEKQTATLVETQLEIGRRALTDKEYQRAVEQTESVLKLNPTNPEALGIREQAQSALKEINTWVKVAREAMGRGESVQASQALSRVLVLDPKNAVVAELSTGLNASFSARATDARTEMEKARVQAEMKEGAVDDPAFAEGDEFANAAAKSFEDGEFTAATQTFMQARDAYDRARRGAPGRRPVGAPVGAGRPAVSTAPTPATSAPTESAPAATPPPQAAAAAQTPQTQPTTAPGTGEVRAFVTGPTQIEAGSVAEFAGRFEFEVVPSPLRLGAPFRIRILLKNEGKKDVKLTGLTARITRNGETSNPEAKITEDDAKVGQRPVVAEVPARGSGQSLRSAGTVSWSMDVEATTSKGERLRCTLSMQQP